jgi:two-component system, chemotaxis family, sensor kinase CheA
MDTFQESLAAAREILGGDFLSSGKVRTIPENRLFAFANCLRGKNIDTQLSETFFEQLIATPVWESLNEFAVTLQELADRFGKPLNPCLFSGKNFPVLQPVYEPVFASFIHIARNIIDHGIEAADIRKAHGKPPYATVSVYTESFQHDGRDWFAIEFNDDGGGIDLATFRMKLMEKGLTELAKADNKTVLEHIFDGGVSTKKQTTLLSGRGIGLNTVKAEVGKLGGIVTISTNHGHGTTLRVELPFIRTLA